MLSLFVRAVGMVSSELFLRVRPVALVLVGGPRSCRGWLSSSMSFSSFTAAISRLSSRVGRDMSPCHSALHVVSLAGDVDSFNSLSPQRRLS